MKLEDTETEQSVEVPQELFGIQQIRCRPAVRISGFHPGDPGSIPGNGNAFLFVLGPKLKELLPSFGRLA